MAFRVSKPNIGQKEAQSPLPAHRFVSCKENIELIIRSIIKFQTSLIPCATKHRRHGLMYHQFGRSSAAFGREIQMGQQPQQLK